MSPAVASLASLGRFVESVEIQASDGEQPLSLERLPDGRTSLAFRAFDSGGHDLTVIGPRLRAVFKVATGIARVVIVRFKPGWSSALFGVSARELAERYVSLDALWGHGIDSLADDLLAARGASDVIGRLSDAFARRGRDLAEPASAALARRAVRLLEGDMTRVDRVAERLGVTARHLRRAFVDSIGIGPKDFARTVRLRRAVHRAGTSHDWSRVATDTGYYDQAHLIGEFRELVGLTPVEYVKRRREHVAADQRES